MSDKRPIKFPVEAEMKVVITNGEAFGVATIGLGFGGFPTDQEVKERIERFEREELAGLTGYRLATAPERWFESSTDHPTHTATGQHHFSAWATVRCGMQPHQPLNRG